MSVKIDFDLAATLAIEGSSRGAPPTNAARRTSPFSLRLTEAERARLEREAGGAPLGAFIKAKALGDTKVRLRRTGLSIQDREALARVLALLGSSRLANNLNQLAYAANIGALPFTTEVESELRETLEDVREMRALLLQALGIKQEEKP